MQLPIYLDYASTTPVDPRVAEKMADCLTMGGVFANPASRSHVYGWQAEEQVELARRHVASLLACDPREIVWTSGATESNNLALKGIFESAEFAGGLVTSTSEHKAIIDPAKWLSEKGVTVHWLEPGRDGVIDVEKVRLAISDQVRLVSIMLVNNETGVINPIAEIGKLCREKGVLLHVDASQAVGRVDIDVSKLSVDLMSVSAHKFYGPKGVGALYVRRSIQSQLKPLILGGGHERGMRSGTLATHQLAGMGEAARLIKELEDVEADELAGKRDCLWAGIEDLPGVRRNGGSQNISPSHLNVCFSGVDGETLLLALRELAVSSGSACTSASLDPSYVLTAMGISDEDAHSSIRISIGRFTSDDDVNNAVDHIRKIYTELNQTQSI